jgi:hypothetical protein
MGNRVSNSFPHVSKALRRVAIFVLSMAFVGCALVPLVSREINFSYRELTERAEKRFPFERDVGGLLKVTLSRPRIDVVRNDDGSLLGRTTADRRVRTSVDVAVKLPLTNKVTNGVLILSGIPRYDASAHSIFLREVQVERVRVDNMPEALSAALAKAATQFARDSIEEKPLRTFTPDELSRWGVQLNPQRIEVRDTGLALIL